MAPSPSLRTPGVILPIQVLRGIAALMVVWHHARNQIEGVQAIFPSESGTSGVDLFFVISGFIMVVTTAEPGTTPWKFLRRRIIRVVPMYWLLTLAMVAVALVAPSLFKTLKVAPGTLLQSLLFIPHFSQSFPTSVWPLLVPGWTLNFEMFFYAVFGAALWLPLRARLAAITLAFVSLAGIGVMFGPFTSAAAQTYTHSMLLEFAAGALIGGWWVRGGPRLPLAVSIASILIGASMVLLRDAEPLRQYTQIIGAALVVVGALDAHFRAWRSRWLLALGDSSYSLYLTHIFTLGAVRVVWVKAVPSAPTLLTACLFMLVSLGFCAFSGWLTYRWVEAPLLRRLIGRRRPAPPRALAAG